MSDYNPNLGPGPDRYGRYPNDPPRDPAYDHDNGRSGFALIAILAGLALVGGFLYFGNPTNKNDQQAQTPPATERTLTETPQAGPRPDRPAMPLPANPAPQATPQPSPQE